MMWMGNNAVQRRFQDTDTPSPDGATTVVNRSALPCTAARKSFISSRLLTTLWARKRPPRVSRGYTRIKELLVVRLPRIEEDEVDNSLNLWNLLEGVAADHRNHIVEAGTMDVRFRLARPLRVILDGRQASARFAQPQPNPDGAVSARGTDLERPLRTARCNHQAQESAILFRNGQLTLVGPPDLLQKPLQGRGQAGGNGRLLAGDRGNRSQGTDEDQDTEEFGHHAHV